jgi:hypothetical protein
MQEQIIGSASVNWAAKCNYACMRLSVLLKHNICQYAPAAVAPLARLRTTLSA